MCTYADLVDHIAGCRINDEFSEKKGDWKVWKRDVIQKAVKEAVSSVFALRPDLFAVDKEVTLEKGKCVQCFCDDCCRIIGVISVNGDTCNVVEEKEDEDDEFSLAFLDCYYKDCPAPNCYGDDNKPDGSGYDPGWWDQVETSPCCIRFENPPPRAGIKAVVSCVPNDVLTGENLPCVVCTELFQAIIDNALFRLYAIDHKDGNNLRIAEAHWQAYTTTMVTKFAVDYSLFENNYLLTRRRIDE